MICDLFANDCVLILLLWKSNIFLGVPEVRFVLEETQIINILSLISFGPPTRFGQSDNSNGIYQIKQVINKGMQIYSFRHEYIGKAAVKAKIKPVKFQSL